jgi:hypothetical protein
MRFVKGFVILGLCILMGTCLPDDGILVIDIGDYENQLAAWNGQNMIDYQIRLEYSSPSNIEFALITVKNGIPICSDPSYWLEYERPSTISEFYSYIKGKEIDVRDEYKGGNSSCSLKVSYNNEYHYPRSITLETGSYFRQMRITLMPLEEGDLEIDIGGYENQLEAWNSRNMLDYHRKIHYSSGNYISFSHGFIVDFIVTNGIPRISEDRLEFVKTKGTIPEIYCFIKEKEEIIREGYNGNRRYLYVQYDTEYHYPTHIAVGADDSFGSYASWVITLTPLGEN